MRPLAEDTPAEIEEIQARVWAQLPPGRRLGLVFDLCAQARALALAGIRTRHPSGDESVARRLYAEQALGPALAARAYGPLPKALADCRDGR